jgi:hypothetical protein
LLYPLSYEGATRSRIPVWAYVTVPGRPCRYSDGAPTLTVRVYNHGPHPDPIVQDRIPLCVVLGVAVPACSSAFAPIKNTRKVIDLHGGRHCEVLRADS